MPTVNYTPASNEHAQLYKKDSIYATVRNSVSAQTVTSSNTSSVGQQYSLGNYNIWRFAIGFDTSGLDPTALITSAYITFVVTNENYPLTVILKNGMPTYPTIPTPIAGDFDRTLYSDNGGTGIVAAAATSLVVNFNATGKGWINRTGYSKFLIISQEDEDGTPPTGTEKRILTTLVGPPSQAILTVEYYIPTEAPTVTTTDAACEDRQSTTLTAVGTVTDAGGGYTYRGFEYYEKGDDLEYDSSMYAVREIGIFATAGTFRMTLNGLKPSTVYYIRAFAGNVFGINYGEWVECSTTAVPSYSVYEEANTAKYTLYVSDDEAIAWRGYRGPYSGKQQNINITDLVNKTKGVKVIKLVPTAKGTFHVVVTVKQQLKN